MDDCLVCRVHTRRSSIRNNKYQALYKYSCFSWWWARSWPKHVEKRNKHTKKNCAPSWLHLEVFIGLIRMPRRRMLHFPWTYILFPTPVPWLYIQIEYWVACCFLFYLSSFSWKLGGGGEREFQLRFPNSSLFLSYIVYNGLTWISYQHWPFLQHGSGAQTSVGSTARLGHCIQHIFILKQY